MTWTTTRPHIRTGTLSALALSSAVIYLPTRRAARSFGDAFARVMGGAALLPQFKPLGDSDEDELLFDAAAEGLEFRPAIAPLRRQLLLAQLVRRWDLGRGQLRRWRSFRPTSGSPPISRRPR